MSRGIGLGNPKEIKKNVKSVCYDDAGFLWTFDGSEAKRYFIHDLYLKKQVDVDTEVDETVQFISTSYWYSPVIVDDYIYVAEDEVFTSFQRIDIRTGSIRTYNTPYSGKTRVKMNSNIIFEGSKIWMVTDEIESQTDDRHKMYTYDTVTNLWSSSFITTKKQKEAFKIWSCGTDHVFTSNWTNFSCSYFNKLTGAYIGSFPINGYPGIGADVGDHTALVPSFAGMVSVVGGVDHVVTNSYNTLLDTNDKTSGIVYFQGQIWFYTPTDFGRVFTSTKEVVHTSIEGNQDAVILKSVGQETVDSSYTLQKQYGLTNSAYKQMVLVPQYTYKDINNQTQTEPAKVVLVGSAITIINPNEVRFVFDKPEVKASMVYATGNGMITTGDTGYIGEFG